MLKFIKRYSKIWMLVAGILLSIGIYLFRDKFVHLQGYGYLGLFILSILGNATIVLPMPVVFSAFVGGAVFNPFIVAVLVSLGATIGELTGYLAGYGAEEIIQKDKRLLKANEYMDKHGLWTLFILSTIPNPLFDLAGIVAGATKIPVWKYFIVVWAGKFIKFGAIALAGSKSITFLEKYI